MTDLVITSCRIVQAQDKDTLPFAEALEPGQAVRLDDSTGKLTKANGTTADEAQMVGVLATEGGAGVRGTFVRQGLLDVGNALSALDYGATIFLSDTDGALADAAGTIEVPVAVVWPAFGTSGVADKLLKVDVPLVAPPAVEGGGG